MVVQIHFYYYIKLHKYTTLSAVQYDNLRAKLYATSTLVRQVREITIYSSRQILKKKENISNSSVHETTD